MLSPIHHHRRDLSVYLIRFFLCTLSIANVAYSGGDLWPLDRPENMPTIQSLEVMCGKDHMDVHLTFSQPFEGIVSSKGQHGDPRCVYVPPSTGQTFFSFRIAYARCGTKPDLNGQFYENTVVVQYDKDLLEVWDEAKRLRCEWFNDYEKTASKPPMVIADLDVIQLDFRGDNVDCWMEIQHGKGPWAPPVSGIVPLGSTLTLVVAINDYRGEFDMRVKSCAASDGGGHVIQLSDEFGCVLRPKMISRFLKARGADERASVITYAFFHAFKFPDALSVHIKCKVEICRHGCMDHCQAQTGGGEASPDLLPHQFEVGGSVDRKDDQISAETRIPMSDDDGTNDEDVSDDVVYDEMIRNNDEEEVKMPLKSAGQAQLLQSSGEFSKQDEQLKVDDDDDDDNHRRDEDAGASELDITEISHKDILSAIDKTQFPHGPRTFDRKIPAAAPRSLPAQPPIPSTTFDETNNTTPENTTKPENLQNRNRRSIVISDRKTRSTDVGVSGLYEVISEADLAFSPDNRVEAVTVFQGRIREEVVYGICMPVPGFSLLFVLVAVSAVVSALVAGSLLYRYQLQREQMAAQRQRFAMPPFSFFSHWIGGMLRMRQNSQIPIQLEERNGCVTAPADSSVNLNGQKDTSMRQ